MFTLLADHKMNNCVWNECGDIWPSIDEFSLSNDIWPSVKNSLSNNDFSYLGMFELKLSIFAENIYKKVESGLRVADSLSNSLTELYNDPHKKQNMYIGFAAETKFFMNNFRLDNKFTNSIYGTWRFLFVFSHSY
jgi:hypothetical protein